MQRRVTIGTCSGPAEVALVRAAFEAHDIPVLINAEHHAGMLGGLGGTFVPLHIYVDEADAEDAAALLADVRARDRAAELDEVVDPEDDAEADERAQLAVRKNRRYRLVLLVTFAFASATVLPFLWAKPALAFSAVGLMLVAMVWLMRAGTSAPTLPRARVRRVR